MSIRKFDKWFEENREELKQMIRSDNYEMLYKAWAAGCDSMSKTVSDLSWYESPDRSGGQFTDEEINRSRRGGEGW